MPRVEWHQYVTVVEIRGRNAGCYRRRRTAIERSDCEGRWTRDRMPEVPLQTWSAFVEKGGVSSDAGIRSPASASGPCPRA